MGHYENEMIMYTLRLLQYILKNAILRIVYRIGHLVKIKWHLLDNLGTMRRDSDDEVTPDISPVRFIFRLKKTIGLIT